MPSDFAFKTLNTIHRTIQTVSGGRLGWSLAKMLVVELTTTGRKSGQPRSVLLTSPHQDGDTIVLIASRGGDDHHPAWLLNLRDNPSVTVGTKDGTTPMTARIADEAERAEAIEHYPWDGVENLRLLTQMNESVVVGVY